jgi:hypothetical protein
MVTRIAMVGALAAVLAVSTTSNAQDARPAAVPEPLELTREATPARPIVRPERDRSQASRDAAKDAAEYEQRQRDDALVREQMRPSRRPDLGYDVTSGIQQRNLRR